MRAAPVRLPREYGRLALAAGDWAGREAALILDRGSRTVTAVLSVAGSDRFALLGAQEQHRLLAGWGEALTGLAGEERSVRRVQWVERLTREDREDALAWMSDRWGDAPADQRGDYAELAARTQQAAVRHQVLLALQFAGSGQRPDAAITAALAGARHAASRLLAAQLVARPLTRAELADALRTAARGPNRADDSGGVGPTCRRVGWDHLRTDDRWHRSYAVRAWPRVPLGPTWLEPLLRTAPAGAERTLAVHLEPVPAAAAMRRARAARARAQLDRADRSRFGLGASAAADRAAEDTVSAEEELTAGYATHQVAALVTCTADSLSVLDEGCRTVRTAAASARLELQPLHGQQDLAFVAGLPLCRLRQRGER